MISFRFYVVSVVAFFLAIAVGLVLGSSLDGRISDSLKDRLERVESNLDATVEVVDGKNNQIDQLTTFADQVTPYAVQNRLAGTNTLVVAQSGLKPDEVTRLVTALRDAGSAVPGVMWVDKAWSPQDAAFGRQVRKILTEDAATIAPGDLEEATWTAVLDALAVPVETTPPTDDLVPPTTTPGALEPGAEPEATTTTIATTTSVAMTTTTDGQFETVAAQTWWELPLLRDLGQASLVSLDGLGKVEGEVGVLNIMVVVGPDSELSNDDSEMISLARIAAERGIPIVIAEVGPTDADSDEDLSVLAPLVKSIDAGSVSSVQGADHPSGRVAVVAALANASLGEFGVFGTGPMATSVLPPLLGDNSGP